MTLEQTMLALGDGAREAARQLARAPAEQKNEALRQMAGAIEARRAAIGEANQADLAEGREAGLTAALLDRLELSDRRLASMVDGLRQVAALPDPVGELLERYEHPSGLVLDKVRVPIGVIGVIYESRPNVTADAGGLCLKAGNAVILRGGREARRSNRQIAAAMGEGAVAAGLPEAAIQLVHSTDREAVRLLVQMVGRVDLVIPRGGEGLIGAVTDLARVPVIKHYKGVCHTYVDASADIERAVAICENAKCQRPGVCNAMETLLVHRGCAGAFLPAFAERVAPHGVELRGDPATCAILAGARPASDSDWEAEYLDLILAVRVVDDVDAAIAHIARYGSGHSDAIVAEDTEVQQRFVASVDSAAVYVNASTRFTDGAEFGLGAEIGISTDKLHARGPMGVRELTSYKYIGRGAGHVR